MSFGIKVFRWTFILNVGPFYREYGFFQKEHDLTSGLGVIVMWKEEE